MSDVSQIGSEILSALAHPNRIRIIKRLQEGKTCNCELIKDLKIEQSNLSRHLKLLTQAGILIRTQEGVKVFYEIADKRVLKMIDLAIDVARSTLERRSRIMQEFFA